MGSEAFVLGVCETRESQGRFQGGGLAVINLESNERDWAIPACYAVSDAWIGEQLVWGPSVSTFVWIQGPAVTS